MLSLRFLLAVAISFVLHVTFLAVFACWPLAHLSLSSGGGGIDTRVPSVEAIVLLTEAPPRNAARVAVSPPVAIPKPIEAPQPIVSRAPDPTSSQAQSRPAQLATGAAAAPPGGSGIAGPGAGTATFFQLKAAGQSIVYVIDCSMSMGRSGGFELARQELLVSLNHLPVSAHFQVIPYNRNAEPLLLAGRRELVAATPVIKQRAADLLRALHA
jgi:hypothetical protein